MRTSAPRTLRLSAYAVSAAMVVSGSVLAVTPVEAAPAPTDPIGVDHGAAWLERQLTGGVVHNDQYDFDDLGLTADVALGLAEVGGRDDTVRAVVDAIEPRAEGEYYTSSWGGTTTTYAGSLAKLLVLAQTAGVDATSFGGVDLVARLEGRVAGPGPAEGRIQNQNDSFGDANVIGQAFAAAGLRAAGSSRAGVVTDFLLAQQCPGGFFRLDFTPGTGAADQSCDEGAPGSAPNTDATAIAMLQLSEQVDASPTVAAAWQKARAWLASRQKADGSFGGGPTTEESNANSTGLAGWALGGPAGALAARWLRDRQASFYDVCDALVRERGALAYDDAALAAGRSGGITAESRDQFRRASAQALPALRHLAVDPDPADPVLSGPSGYRKAGGRARLVTQGVGDGDRLCLNGPRTKRQHTATGPSWVTTVTLPAGTRAWKYAVRDADGHVGSTTVDVLGRKTLVVRTSAYRVRRGDTVTVVIRGLAPRERARVHYRSRLVRSGTATASGRFVATVRVDRRPGRQVIRGYGQFGDIRRGTAVVRVVR